MTYTFKLSRRLARLRDASLVVAAFFSISCTSDESIGPESGPVSDPNGISVAPGSVVLSPNQAMQFLASTLESSGLITTSSKGRGRGRRTVVNFSVAPETLTVAGGSGTNFVATATLSDSSTIEPSVTWSASGGSIDAKGKYTAGATPGTYAVSATTSSGVADTAAVIVTQSLPMIVELSLSPVGVSLPIGGTKRFIAVGKADDGSTVAVAARYAATGGTVSADGIYQAGQTPGNFRVIATDTVSNLADTAAVIIEAPPATLQAVVLTPATASLTAGGTQQFTVTGKMSDGSTTSVVVSWSVTGGQITSEGLYTAGATAGAFRVIATQQGGTLADTATVSITAPAPAPSPPQAGDLPTPLRTVNVSTTSALKAAMESALPGDRIVMAPGSYDAGSLTRIARSGTVQNPIVLTGPRTAIITGGAGDGLLVSGNYWIFNGFRVSGTTNAGIVNRGGNYNIYEYLEIDHTGTLGLSVATGASTVVVTGNVVRYNSIHDTGLARADYGEGIYLGNGTCGCEPALNTHVHHNTIGPNVRADGIEAKVSANSNRIEFNTLTSASITIRSNNNTVTDNTVSATGVWSLIGTGSDVAGKPASNNSYLRNRGSGTTQSGMFFVDNANATNTQIFCDNVATGLPLGVACTR